MKVRFLVAIVVMFVLFLHIGFADELLLDTCPLGSNFWYITDSSNITYHTFNLTGAPFVEKVQFTTYDFGSPVPGDRNLVSVCIWSSDFATLYGCSNSTPIDITINTEYNVTFTPFVLPSNSSYSAYVIKFEDDYPAHGSYISTNSYCSDYDGGHIFDGSIRLYDFGFRLWGTFAAPPTTTIATTTIATTTIPSVPTGNFIGYDQAFISGMAGIAMVLVALAACYDFIHGGHRVESINRQFSRIFDKIK
jgi:hypothetical protein